MQYRINDGTGELVFRAERGLVYKINDKFGERTHVFNESPWVHIESPRKGMDDFAKFIQNHNSLGIIWNFEKLQGSETFRLETSPRYDLMQMRQDSEDLAYEILGSEKI